MRILLITLTVAMLGTTASAQFNSFKNRQRNRARQPGKATLDLSVEPSAAPSEELDVSEFQLQRRSLGGKVVELKFDRVLDLKQTGNGYSARVTFESGRLLEGIMLLIPEEGLELFQEMAERDPRSPLRKKVYVEVLTGSVTRAVGTRYRKNKPEGERYSW